MPVIPTYRAGVGAADLSGAYLGASRIAQEAYSDAARIQLGREQLAQQAVANEMELAAKREALAFQTLKNQQEQEIEKAYRQTQIGLKERELANEDAITQMKLKQAANDFAALQEYKTMVDSGVPPDAAMRRVGFGQPGFASAFSKTTTPVGPSLNVQRLLLNDEERSILKKPAWDRTPEDNAKLEEIAKKRQGLGLTVPGTGGGASMSPSRQPFIVNPNTIPVGGSPKMFIGTPPTPQMDTSSLSVPSTLARSTSSTPKPGDVIKGYRFKGGDPSDRTNWEKVK